MNEQNNRRVDLFQNLAIAFLAVCAVFLFSRTEIFQLGQEIGSAYFHDFPESAEFPETSAQNAALILPAHLVVTGAYGRYANLSLTTAEASFRPLRALLGDALETDEPFTDCAVEEFMQALTFDSLMCDFLHHLPLCLLNGRTMDTRPVRALALVREEDIVILYCWDGDMQAFRRPTSLPVTDLEEFVGQYELGKAFFALDQNDLGSLAPLSLFPDQTPRLPVLSATVGLIDQDRLLTGLQFNPMTNFRYPESNGTEVIVESGRSVRVRADGSVYYQSGGRLSDPGIASAGEIPTLQEAAIGGAALIHLLLPSIGEGASVYLREIAQEEENTILRYDYQINGMPIRFSDGGCAAEISLSGRIVTALELRPRQYIATQTPSQLLPRTQAIAIAALYPGAEMSLAYADNGGSQVSVEWICD